MLHGGALGELEIRRDGRGRGRRLRGTFPYDRLAVLSDGGRNGRPRKERIAPKAFAYRIERQDEEIHLLFGHDYNRPLASRGSGTLTLRDTPEAVAFDAQILPQVLDTPYGQDVLGAFDAGLMRGISPGFRIPPKRTVPDAEKVEEEDPALGQALIRSIFQALLFELSLVTVAAYREAFAEAAEAEEEEERAWDITAGGCTDRAPLCRTLNRWRV